MTTLVVQCADCLNYITGMACKAFVRIPVDVWFSREDHTYPIEGDHGFQKVTLTKAAAAMTVGGISGSRTPPKHLIK